MPSGSKQHKYLYKKKINGKWRYWYKETKKDLDELVNEGKNKLQRLLDRLTKSGLHERYTVESENLVNFLGTNFYNASPQQAKYYEKGQTFAAGLKGKTVTPEKKALDYGSGRRSILGPDVRKDNSGASSERIVRMTTKKNGDPVRYQSLVTGTDSPQMDERTKSTTVTTQSRAMRNMETYKKKRELQKIFDNARKKKK
jgi:hypothetical protein